LSIDAGQRVARFIFVEARERGQQKLTFELEASALGFACRKLLAQREENAVSPKIILLQKNYNIMLILHSEFGLVGEGP